jgi:hypothetical protein
METANASHLRRPFFPLIGIPFQFADHLPRFRYGNARKLLDWDPPRDLRPGPGAGGPEGISGAFCHTGRLKKALFPPPPSAQPLSPATFPAAQLTMKQTNS